jgi:hypothetical protein
MADRSLCSSPSSSRVLVKTAAASKLKTALFEPEPAGTGMMGLTRLKLPEFGREGLMLEEEEEEGSLLKFIETVFSGSTSV